MNEVTLREVVPKEFLTKEQFDLVVRGLALSSRDVKAGDLFCAYPGRSEDGRRYIADAIAAGASAVIVESGVPHRCIPESTDVPIIEVAGLEKRVGEFAARFYQEPAERLQLVGITGTNGKTTCSYFISHALSAVDIPCRIMGTLGQGAPGQIDANSTHTTPNPIELQKQLAQWQADSEVQAVAMEVSSHGLDQGRVAGCRFYTALFTNLTQDHLDYHGTMESYAEAKKQLFSRYQIANAVVNIDDALGLELLKEVASEKRSVNCFTYSLSESSLQERLVDKNGTVDGVDLTRVQHLYAKSFQQTSSGVTCTVVTPLGECLFSSLPIWGSFNISNLLATIATLLSFKCSLSQIEKAIHTIAPPEGRMQCVYGGGENEGVEGLEEGFNSESWRGPKVFIDYAHSPDAVEKALVALREHCAAEQRLMVVLGCGGDRDVGKRSQMGKMAAEYADQIIVTTDNPRYEAPESIAHQVVEGIKQVEKIPPYKVYLSRRAAIWQALSTASSDDLVVVLGRGHERHQQVGALSLPMLDADLVQQGIVQAQRRASLDGCSTPQPESGQYLWTLGEMAEAVGAELRGGDQIIYSLSTDTRNIEAGSLFVALKGERFDAHQFVDKALEAGATAAVIEAGRYEELQGQLENRESGCSWLLVNDTRIALGLIAKAWKQRLQLPTIALTGSCGKTSVKETIAQILRQQGEVLATQGNFNNDIGVPLTLFRLRAEHQYAVIEMGANHAGEIDYTCAIVEPDVALITNAAEAHLEGFGSVAGVAKAKGEIYNSVAPEGFALINADDAHHGVWLTGSEHLKQLTFSADLDRQGADQADIQLVSVEKSSCPKDRLTVKTPKGLFTFTMPLLGRHQWSNALVAIAAAERVGISEENIIAGLESLQPIRGRLFAETVVDGLTIIDDTYNANPHSVRAAIDLLSECEGPVLLILGMMAEMGEGFQEGHEGIGRYIAELNRTQAASGRCLDAVIVVGEGGEWIRRGLGDEQTIELNLYPSNDQLIADIESRNRSSVLNLHERFRTILVKGSRSAAMEEVVAAIKAVAGERGLKEVGSKGAIDGAGVVTQEEV